MSDPPGLGALATRLGGQRPPALGILLRRLEELRDGARLVRLTEDLLGQHLAARVRGCLRRRDEEAALQAFGTTFERRYFPLDFAYLPRGSRHEGLVGAFLAQVPTPALGFSWENVASAWDLREGLQLVLALAEDPWGRNADPELRLDIRQTCELACGDEALLADVPWDGIPLPTLFERLEGTLHEPLAWCAAWLRGSTGNLFLDTADEGAPEDPAWDRPTVERLAGAWREAERFERAIFAWLAWVEADLAGRAPVVVAAALAPSRRIQPSLFDLPPATAYAA